MNESSPPLRGDKLRDALLAVWLATKYRDELSIADLTKISKYQKTGLYSAMDGGWFKQVDGIVKLTPKGESYVKDVILKDQNSGLMYIRYIFVLVLLLFIQSLAFNYGINLIPNPLGSGPALIGMLLIMIFYYRIIWTVLKRRKNA